MQVVNVCFRGWGSVGVVMWAVEATVPGLNFCPSPPLKPIMQFPVKGLSEEEGTDWELFVGGKATITHKKGQGRRPGAIIQKARRSRAVKGADTHAPSLSLIQRQHHRRLCTRG